MLSVRALAVEVGGTLVLEGAGFTVRAGDKVGLVGRNGAGKTSLLKVLGGMAVPKAGVVNRPDSFGYLAQDPLLDGVPDERTALAHVLNGRGLDELTDRLEKLRLQMEEAPGDESIVAKWSRTHDRFEHEGGYAAEAEARAILAGLGLRASRADFAIGVLSGGERRRVELARILFSGSDLLMLDEPTNHLDNDARDWLLGYMRTYRGGLIVISHDLGLLDESITRVLHLDRVDESSVGHMVEYKGTYSQYQRSRAADEERLAKVAAREKGEIDRLQTLVDRFGAKASKASMAHSLEKRIARIEAGATDGPRATRTLDLKLPPAPASGRTTMVVAGVKKSYGGLPPVFEGVGFDVGRGERLLVLGLNGAGKTSLLRILAGTSDADAGSVAFGHKVSVGYFAQEHETISPGRTLLELAREYAPDLGDQERRRLLGTFGLQGDKVHQDAGTLSGGEKTKLALSLLVGGRHNLLLLDEPTNNLDPPSRQAIATALSSWTGTMVIVSHDAHFVRDLRPNRALLMPDGDLDHWSDDLIDLVELA
ncbi:MAG: ABC-F family ATP-binding cassette domain-containing protein [Acidimicrobiia bacterium]|nr:ABC-F family ATP-binding cassette domain-containing protein [Acidimicrobiia bacterium]